VSGEVIKATLQAFTDCKITEVIGWQTGWQPFDENAVGMSELLLWGSR
jgi:hypothetical protein